MHSIATNDHQTEKSQPIRRSRRLQHRQKEREDLKHSFSDEDVLETPSRKLKTIDFNPGNTINLYINFAYFKKFDCI